jgi:hypothetical protein
MKESQIKALLGVVCKTVGAVMGVCPATVTKLGLFPSQRVIGFADNRITSLIPAEYAARTPDATWGGRGAQIICYGTIPGDLCCACSGRPAVTSEGEPEGGAALRGHLDHQGRTARTPITTVSS